MLVTKIIERDMGHRLLDHASKCRHLHGHRYKAEITLEWTIIEENWVSNNGMVADFSDIKKIALAFINEELDHWYIYQKWDPIGQLCQELELKAIPVDFAPTAENIASYLFSRLDHLYQQQLGTNIQLYSIKLWETPNCYVTIGKVSS